MGFLKDLKSANRSLDAQITQTNHPAASSDVKIKEAREPVRRMLEGMDKWGASKAPFKSKSGLSKK